MTSQQDIKEIFPGALREDLAASGFEPYRAVQVLEWVWKKRVALFGKMKNIPAQLREHLEKHYVIRTGAVRKKAQSADGTIKFLIEFPGNTFVETVFIPSEEHNTVCVSTQAGCAAGCVFCATGACGFQRDLSAGEIVEQVMLAEEEAGKKAGNVVLMGMGEPLFNYDSAVAAVRLMNAPHALGIGARRITISTVGIPEKIIRLAGEKDLQVRLAVSLHAPDDALRSRLVPVNRKYRIADVLEACRLYSLEAKKYVSFEYLLIKGINDTDAHARRLASLLSGWKARVNLIPWNPVPLLPYERPLPADVKNFQSVLKAGGVNCTVRKERGVDIEAACGQLRTKNKGL
jgi:23S rRNA (adenine2503-C2)-methyltransferase